MFELPLSRKLASRRWKVKIWDDEIREHPHLTILWKTNRWRWGIRQKDFLEQDPDPSEIPEEVMKAIEVNYPLLCKEWNRIHPKNPVVVPEENADE